jgi:hypothetical protein
MKTHEEYDRETMQKAIERYVPAEMPYREAVEREDWTLARRIAANTPGVSPVDLRCGYALGHVQAVDAVAYEAAVLAEREKIRNGK